MRKMRAITAVTLAAIMLGWAVTGCQLQEAAIQAEKPRPAASPSRLVAPVLPPEEPAVLEIEVPVPADTVTEPAPDAPGTESPGLVDAVPEQQAAAALPLSPPGLPAVAPGLIFHADQEKPRVAITFDACETEKPARFDEAVWSVLMEKQARATLFLGGKWMESHPEATRMMGQSDLIEIGNHSYLHPHFEEISEERASQEIKRTQQIQWELLGRQGRLFRFPFGTYDEKSLKIVAQAGLYPIQWDVTSGDPDRNFGPKRMTKNVLKNARNGSIIIFHINGRGWHTAKALPAIIDGLRQQGFELVTVSELLELDAAPTPTSPAAGPVLMGK